MPFSFWGYINSLSFGNRLHPSACYRHSLKLRVLNNTHLTAKLQSWCSSPVGAGINPMTGFGSICVSHRVMWISWLTQISCVLAEKCFFSFPQYKGIIIPIYFCVLQSWHPETRHGDKTWTTGPRKSCSLFCHHHLLFNPFLCNAHLFFQYTMIYIYMYINKTNIFTEFSYCKHCRVSVWNVK